MINNITRVEYQGKEITLIGTSHVSKESASLVKETMEEIHPDSICIELDEDRYQTMKNPEKWKNTNVIEVIKSKKVGLLLANLILSSYQRNIAKNLGTVPGQEMQQGIVSAEEQQCNLVLADRNIQTTFLRIWRKLSLWKKCQLFAELLCGEEEESITEDEVKTLMEKDNIEAALGSVSESFPQITEILITERNQYLAEKIKNAPGDKVVAVLGAAHVTGVKEEIFQEHDLDQISEIPKALGISRVIKWGIPIIIVLLMLYAFGTSYQTGMQQLSSWIVWNSVLAGLFTALILGHPLSILTAAITAPITSLNPLIACGWFAGFVEATIKKPKVEDIDNVPHDIFHLKGFIHNRFLKSLAIVIFANLGSSIGTFIAGTSIIKNLL